MASNCVGISILYEYNDSLYIPDGYKTIKPTINIEEQEDGTIIIKRSVP